MRTHLKQAGMARTREEAYELNLERAHECLVEAKACLYAASQQSGDHLAAAAVAESIAETVHTTVERIHALRFSS